jgi:archaellum biogenesis ATPase FlaH
MGARPQWFIYRLYERDPTTGKYQKHPVDARTRTMPATGCGGFNMCTDWQMVAQAGAQLQAAARTGELYLPGFWLTANDPFWFLDIDGCVIQDAQNKPAWSPLALELLAALPAAARETSSSGRGWHVIGSGAVPPHSRKNSHLNLEFYSADRGVALTFEQLSGNVTADCSGAVGTLVAKYFQPSANDSAAVWTSEPVWYVRHPDIAQAIEMRKRESQTFASLITDAEPPGDRSKIDFELCCELLRLNGGNDQALLELMQGGTLALHRPKWSREDYLRRTISGAHAEVATDPPPDPNAILWAATLPPGVSSMPIAVQPTPTARFVLIDAWAFADGPDPQWRIEGLLPQQGLAMVFGASGSGKTFFVLDLSMAVALGVERYGHDKRGVTAGRVVYIVAEGVGGFRKRLRAYREYHKLAPNSPAPKLVTAAPNFMNAADVSELLAAILAAGGADIIVIDTLHASVAGADENSAKDMGQFLGHCRALQAATGGLVLLIHHSGKDEERGARGSSALRAAMDTEIEVTGADQCSVAHVTKQRDGDTAGAVCFRIAPVPLFGDRPTVSAAVEHIDRPAKSRKARASDEQSLAVEMVQTYPNGVQLEVLAVALQQQRPDKRAANIRRSIERAIDAGLLSIDKGQNVRLAQA